MAAFAFADVSYPLDCPRLEEQAGTLAFQFPPDFPTSVNSLRDGARLRGSEGTLPRKPFHSKYQAFKTCRKS